MENQTVVFPEKFADRVRKLDVGNYIDITSKGRSSAYTQARMAFPTATFITVKIENSVYLKRVA